MIFLERHNVCKAYFIYFTSCESVSMIILSSLNQKSLASVILQQFSNSLHQNKLLPFMLIDGIFT